MGTPIERGRYSFRVAEYADGQPWIMTDPLYDTDKLTILGPHGFIGFDLKRGTTYQEAEQTARFLNERITFITCNT
jgi:hypothetical protein